MALRHIVLYNKIMKTAELDIVYFIKEGIRNEEFRYSLRSVCENMPYRRVWVFGGCPRSIVPDVRIRVEQSGKTKWDRVRKMFLMACENKELSDNFILFNDDFFIMQPTDTIEPLYRCPLEKHIKMLGKGPYANILKTAKAELERRGKNTLSYELHVPFIFNKKKLLKLIKDNPDLRCTRTMYGNLNKIGGERSNDVKIFSVRPNFDYKNSTMLSTDDAIVNKNNDVWRYIQKQFPHSCKYEM